MFLVLLSHFGLSHKSFMMFFATIISLTYKEKEQCFGNNHIFQCLGPTCENTNKKLK